MKLHCVSMYTKSFFFFSVSNNDVASKDSQRVCLLLKDAAKQSCQPYLKGRRIKMLNS